VNARCIRCGCTEDRACPGGCAWAVQGILCDKCVRQDDIWFTLAHKPASKKNSRRWIKRGGRRFLVPSAAAVSAEQSIREAARSALDQYSATTFGDDPVRLDYCHDDRLGGMVHVLVSREDGEPANCRADLHGMLETIADALQGVCYANDRQIVAGSFIRIRKPPQRKP
jgi:hypothetical protein